MQVMAGLHGGSHSVRGPLRRLVAHRPAITPPMRPSVVAAEGYLCLNCMCQAQLYSFHML